MNPLEKMKFDGEIFHLWKFKIQMLLEEFDLWGVVSGDEIIENCTSEGGVTKFKKMKKLFAMICLGMDDVQFALVKLCKEVWSGS